MNLAAVQDTNGNYFPADDTHVIASANPFNSDYDLRTNEIVNAVTSTGNRFDFTYYNHSSETLIRSGSERST